jgi:hypothetical protein
MYADREDDFLLFQKNKTGLQLLDSTLCRKLDPRVFSYLRSWDSVPGFTATVTLQQLEATTRVQFG